MKWISLKDLIPVLLHGFAVAQPIIVYIVMGMCKYVLDSLIMKKGKIIIAESLKEFLIKI